MKEKLSGKGIKIRVFQIVLALVLIFSALPISGQALNAADWGSHTFNGKKYWYVTANITFLRNGDGITCSCGTGSVRFKLSLNDYAYTPCDHILNYQPHFHNYKNAAWEKDETNHWQLCVDAACPEKEDSAGNIAAHSGGTATCQVQANCSVCGKAYGELGDHTFAYSAEGNVLTATCQIDGCTESLSLTLTASDATYSGSPYGVVWGGESEWTDAGLTVPELKYYKGTDVLASAPTDVGSYTVKACADWESAADGNTASADFSITKKTWDTAPTVIISDFKKGTYSDEGDGSIRNSAGIVGSGVTYYYNTTNSNAGGTPWTAAAVNGLDEGIYYAYAVFAASDNMDAATTAAAEFAVLHNHAINTFTVGKYADTDTDNNAIIGTCGLGDNYQIKASFAAPNMVYSGNAYDQCSIVNQELFEKTTNTSISIVYYDSNQTQISAPVNAGTYKAGIRVGTAEVTKSFEITKKTVTAPTEGTAEANSFTYDGNAKTYVFASDGDSSDYTVTGNTVTDAGSHTVTVALKSKDNTQWEDETTDDKTFTFTIAKKTVTAPTAGTATYTYNGYAKTYTFASAGDSSAYTVTGNRQTHAGNHTVTVSLKDSANTMWADNSSSDPKTFTFTIGRMEIPKPKGDPRTFTSNGSTQEYYIYYEIGDYAYDFLNVYYQLKEGSPKNKQSAIGTYNLQVEPMSDFKWEDGTIDPISFTFTIKEKQMWVGVYYLEDKTTGSIMDGYIWGNYLQDNDNAGNLKVSTHYVPYIYNEPAGAKATFYVKAGNKTYNWNDLTYRTLDPGTYYVYAVVTCPGYADYTTSLCPIKVYKANYAVYAGTTRSEIEVNHEWDPFGFPNVYHTSIQTKNVGRDYQVRAFATMMQAYQHMYDSLNGKAEYTDILSYANGRQARVTQGKRHEFARDAGLIKSKSLAGMMLMSLAMDDVPIPEGAQPIDNTIFSYAAGLVSYGKMEVETEEEASSAMAQLTAYLNPKSTVTYLLNEWKDEPEEGENYDYTSVNYKKEVKSLSVFADPTEFTPTRAGFTFDGWYVPKTNGGDATVTLSPEGSTWTFAKDTVKWNSDTDRLSSDTILVAKWSTNLHNWQYTVNGNVLKVVCTADAHKNDYGCTHGVTLTLNVSDATYSGEAVTASLGTNEVDAWEAALGEAAPTIVYEAKEGSTLTNGQAVDAGSYTVKVTAGNVTATKDFTINKATTTIEENSKPTASGITYGETLSASTLTGGSASVPGSFAWEDETEMPGVVNEGCKVIFTPTDTKNYTNAECTVEVTVAKRSIEDAEIVLDNALIDNGETQTQKIASVTVTVGEGEDAKVLDVTYDVADNTGKDAGIYKLTVTGNGNFEGIAEKTFVILPAPASKPEVNAEGAVKVGDGSVKVSVEGADVETDSASVIAAVPEEVLSAELLSEIATEGTKVEVLLKAETFEPTAADKAAVSEKLGKYTVGQYLDVSLSLYADGEHLEKITKLNAPISVTVKLPDSLIQKDEDVKRSYTVIRVHDGEAEVLEATFNASNKTLTFQTDRFSTYSVVYKDTKNPKTGDSKTTAMWAGIMLVGLMAVTAGAMLPGKKRNKGKYSK